MSGKTLQDFYDGVRSQDFRVRDHVYQQLLEYLSEPANSLHCDDPAGFVDGLLSWVTSNNFKVCKEGLELTVLLADRMGPSFRPYVALVVAAAAERLGDSKDVVRDQAQTCLLKMMELTTVQNVLDRMFPAVFQHKLWRVRNEGLVLLQATVEQFGKKSFSISRLMPFVEKLMDDQNADVRNMTEATLVELFRHVGDPLRIDMVKRNQLTPNKMKLLLARFDEVVASGQLRSTADTRFSAQRQRVPVLSDATPVSG